MTPMPWPHARPCTATHRFTDTPVTTVVCQLPVGHDGPHRASVTRGGVLLTHGWA